MKKNSSLLNKFMSISLGSLIAMGISFFSTPVITRLISPEQFGMAAIFFLWVDLFGAITLMGTEQSFLRFYFEEKGINRVSLFRKCFAVALSMFSLLSLMGLIFFQNLSQLLFSTVNLKLVVLLCICVLLRTVSTYASVIVRIQEKGKMYSIMQVLNKLLDFFGILLFFYFFGNRYEILIYSQIFYACIVSIVAIGAESQFWNFHKKSKRHIETNIAQILKYGMPYIITFFAMWVLQATDRIIIKMWSDTRELGLYAAAFKIITLLNTVQTSFTAFWIPLSYEKFKENPDNTVLFSDMHETVSYLMILVSVLIMMGRDSIIYLLGSEYRESVLIMPFLIFIPYMYTVSEITVVGINFHKKTQYHIVIAVTVAIFNIIGNLLLVPLLGAKGAAISTGMAYILFFSLRTRISIRFFKVKYLLKKFYFCTLLLVLYAWYLTFNDNLLVSIPVGMGIIFFASICYKKIVKRVVRRVVCR